MSGKLNITIEQGATFQRTINLEDSEGNAISLVGATVAGQLRKDYSSSTSYAFTLTVTDAAEGEISWVMSSATTATIPVTETDRYVYDIEVTYADATVERILEGKATISPEVTR
jgi:hypothetical protein